MSSLFEGAGVQGSFPRKGEVLVYVGRSKPLKDLTGGGTSVSSLFRAVRAADMGRCQKELGFSQTHWGRCGLGL